MGASLLADIAFAASTLKTARAFPNVRMLMADITAEEARRKIAAAQHDLVASVNLLSQLALGKNGGVACAEHLAFLRTLGGEARLITDIRRRYVSREGAFLHEESALPAGLALGEALARWEWNLAPIPERDKAFSVVAEVGCFRF